MIGLRRALLVAAALYVVLTAAPSLPVPLGPGLDRSWILGLRLAHTQNLVAGRDLVWTYGPLGWLHVPAATGSGLYAVLAYQLGIYAVWAAALVAVALRLNSWRVAGWLLFVVGAANLLEPRSLPGAEGVCRNMEHLEVAILTLGMLVLARRPQPGGLALPPLGTLAGVACLVKFDMGVKAALLFLCLAGFAIERRPRAAVALLALPFTVAAGYAASTGQVTALRSYLRYSWELASGYSEAMSSTGSYTTLALAVALLAGLLVAVPLASRDLRSLLAGLLPAAAWAFFCFKHAVVRQDAFHAAPLPAQLALVAALPLLAASNARDRRILILYQIACLSVAAWFFTRLPDPCRHELAERLTLRRARTYAGEVASWPATWQRLEAEGRANLAPLRLDDRFHNAVGSGSVDAVPWEVAAVEANGWTWRPRPVFQSYSAYTPPLDSLNAAHLSSARAADFLLLHWSYIDGRHPFLETPLSWRALLDAYEPSVQDRDWLLLRRRTSPRFAEPRLLSTATGRLNESFTVPAAEGLLVLAADLRVSLPGSLQNALLRLSPVYLEITRRSGHLERWRIVRANLPSGVIVSPLPEGLEGVAGLARGNSLIAEDPVTSLRFAASRPYQYAGEIPLRWYVLPDRR